jgi:hypothetical protein
MGDSRNDFVAGRLLLDSAAVLADSEVWAVNYMASVIRCDKMIALDPLDHPDIDNQFPAGQMKWLRETQFPIISCKKVDGLNIEEYPLKEVTEVFGGFKYFNNTVAYAVALAIYKGAEEIAMFGCDYYYVDPDRPDWTAKALETGRACVEFWLGVAVARGIRVVIAASSSLMDQNLGRPLYGYCDIRDT